MVNNATDLVWDGFADAGAILLEVQGYTINGSSDPVQLCIDQCVLKDRWVPSCGHVAEWTSVVHQN